MKVLRMVLAMAMVLGFALVGFANGDGDNLSTSSLIWAFLNSPLGLTVVGAVLAYVLAKVFTAKPEWKVLAEKYKPLILKAVKAAEKAIPDETENAGLKRLDEALKYLLILNESLGSVSRTSLKQAITVVHAEAEAGGNL